MEFLLQQRETLGRLAGEPKVRVALGTAGCRHKRTQGMWSEEESAAKRLSPTEKYQKHLFRGTQIWGGPGERDFKKNRASFGFIPGGSISHYKSREWKVDCNSN